MIQVRCSEKNAFERKGFPREGDGWERQRCTMGPLSSFMIQACFGENLGIASGASGGGSMYSTCQDLRPLTLADSTLGLIKTVWPSGLRRWLKAPFRKGVGSNPTAVILIQYGVFGMHDVCTLAGSGLVGLAAVWPMWQSGICVTGPEKWNCQVVPRGLEPRTLRLLAVRSNQLSYETSCGFTIAHQGKKTCLFQEIDILPEDGDRTERAQTIRCPPSSVGRAQGP